MLVAIFWASTVNISGKRQTDMTDVACVAMIMYTTLTEVRQVHAALLCGDA